MAITLHRFEQYPKTIAFQKKHGKQLWNFLVQDILGALPATQKTKSISLKHRWRLKRAMVAINRGVPLPLATGTIAFLSHRFRIRRGVFQPRVETEELMQKAISRWFLPPPLSQPPAQSSLQKRESDGNIASLAEKTSPLVIDLCCGSGVMGISAMLGGYNSSDYNCSANAEQSHRKRETLNNIKVIAIDANRKAIKLSRANALHLLPAQKVAHYRVLQADILLHSFPKLLKNFISENYPCHTHSPLYILCNPPYIAEREKAKLSREVLKYDPHLALFSGKDGLAHYRCLARIAAQLLRTGDEMAIELGPNNAMQVKGIFSKEKWLASSVYPPHLKTNSKIQKLISKTAIERNKSKQKKGKNVGHADNKSGTLHTEIQSDMFGKQRFAFIRPTSHRNVSNG